MLCAAVFFPQLGHGRTLSPPRCVVPSKDRFIAAVGGGDGGSAGLLVGVDPWWGDEFGSAVGCRSGSAIAVECACWWWYRHNRTPLASEVGPPSSQLVMWWAWVMPAGRSQPGQAQPPSRRTSASRRWGGKSRWLRPTSRMVEAPLRTAGRILASHRIRRAIPTLMGPPWSGWRRELPGDGVEVDGHRDVRDVSADGGSGSCVEIGAEHLDVRLGEPVRG